VKKKMVKEVVWTGRKKWCDHYAEDRSLYVDDEVPWDKLGSLTPEQRSRLWTAIDCDGKSRIAAGLRIVNRMAYYMSTKPWVTEAELYDHWRDID
jgi:hypothetical protein